MTDGIRACIIAFPLALGLFTLLLAYDDSCSKGRFSWKGLGVSLFFFGVAFMMIGWLA